jgi:hypothetical protein
VHEVLGVELMSQETTLGLGSPPNLYSIALRSEGGVCSGWRLGQWSGDGPRESGERTLEGLMPRGHPL